MYWSLYRNVRKGLVLVRWFFIVLSDNVSPVYEDNISFIVFDFSDGVEFIFLGILFKLWL